MSTRSNRAEVRNPVIGLPAFKKLEKLPRPVRESLAELLTEMGEDCSARAEKCWSTHKAPMAAYWKACGVYCRHIAKGLRRVDRLTIAERMRAAS